MLPMEDALMCGCRNTQENESAMFRVASLPHSEKEGFSRGERPAFNKVADRNVGTDQPSAWGGAHTHPPTPPRVNRYASGSSAAPSSKWHTTGKDSPAKTPKPKR